MDRTASSSSSSTERPVRARLIVRPAPPTLGAAETPTRDTAAGLIEGRERAVPTFTCRVCGASTDGVLWPDGRVYPPHPWWFVRLPDFTLTATCSCTPRPHGGGEDTAQAPVAGPPQMVVGQ